MSLINAKDVLISSISSLPQVGNVLPAWFQTLEFDLITKSIVDFKVVEVLVTTTTQGVRQPMAAQELKLKPEGQRAWRWETIHALPDLILNNDDVIIFNSVRYRVMKKTDWKEYGYVEYQICQDYTG